MHSWLWVAIYQIVYNAVEGMMLWKLDKIAESVLDAGFTCEPSSSRAGHNVGECRSRHGGQMKRTANDCLLGISAEFALPVDLSLSPIAMAVERMDSPTSPEG